MQTSAFKIWFIIIFFITLQFISLNQESKFLQIGGVIPIEVLCVNIEI